MRTNKLVSPFLVYIRRAQEYVNLARYDCNYMLGNLKNSKYYTPCLQSLSSAISTKEFREVTANRNVLRIDLVPENKDVVSVYFYDGTCETIFISKIVTLYENEIPEYEPTPRVYRPLKESAGIF